MSTKPMICRRCDREVDEIDNDGFCSVCAEYAYRMKLLEQARRRKQNPPDFLSLRDGLIDC